MSTPTPESSGNSWTSPLTQSVCRESLDNRKTLKSGKDRLSIPDGVIILSTAIGGATHRGVFCNQGVIPKGTRFGPYCGRITHVSEIKTNAENSYMWEIFKDGKLCNFVDGEGSSGNWLRFINCARHSAEQNLTAVQYGGAVYYESCKDILYGMELLVWYGDNYQQLLGIPIALKDTAEGSAASEKEESEGYKCKKCEKVFAYKYYRDKHLKYTRCVDQGDRKFPCHLCRRSFEKRDRLRIHILHVHEKYRPHKCGVCGKCFSQVELHVHLDGACRPKSIWDIAKRRDMIKTLDIQSMEEFISKLRVTGSGSLPKFVRSFDIFLPILRGDRQAIKRIAIELCEDKANEGVAYFEASYCPHLLADDDVGVSVEEVVRNVNEGFSEGYKKFGVKANSILCMLITKPEWCVDVVRLCDTYRHHGVVGIGLAGNENEPLDKEYFDNMKEALRLNIKRTIHAGETGSTSNVRRAIEVFKAQRIGHGYSCVKDDSVYQLVKASKVHLEVCPTSSHILGSVDSDYSKHPAIRFAKDDVNFSLNTDDPLHFENTMKTEEDIAMKYFGMTQEDIVKSRIRAAEASFLPDNEKMSLVRHLRKQSKSTATCVAL
ncbi:adenosine deaminase-like [Anneissia japonica]|uniref:adenosine deaminase-like n=1 Tax=Anneissia japonica TaxID=1529436 RepID=UPI0014255E70|nr:adenosine deaminase-like [Anneissia japonica]